MDFRIFPTLKGKRSGCINLDACVRIYEQEHDVVLHTEDPHECALFVERMHKERGLDWSWGDYMRPRPHIWKSTYLADTGNWLHLGYDFNVGVGTPVAAPNHQEVVLIDDDFPEPHGWGKRVVTTDSHSGLYVIYAHLGDVECEVGDHLPPGTIFADVGGWKHNGGWYPHLHVQCVTPKCWNYHASLGLQKLDGYGNPAHHKSLMRMYPNAIIALNL